MDSLPPRRRRKISNRSSDDSANQPPRRKKKSSGKKKKKKSKRSIPLIAMIGIPTVVILILASIFFFVDWGSMSNTIGLANPEEELYQQTLTSMNEEVDVLATITDKASAESASIKLQQISLASEKLVQEHSDKRAMEAEKRIKELKKTKMTEQDYKKVQADILSKQKETMGIAKKYKEKFDAVKKRKQVELDRIKGIPGLEPIVQKILDEIQAESKKRIRERTLSKSRKKAGAKGYSVVTPSTNLTIGMRVEVLRYESAGWSRGTISEMHTDGRAKVRLDLAQRENRSEADDKYYDRRDIRIPDKPTPQPKAMTGLPHE